MLALTLWAFFWMKSKGASDELARAVAVNALVIGQIFYLLNSRYKLDSSLSLKAHLGNKYLAMGIGAVVILQLLFTYAPPFQTLFETEAIPLWVWPWLFVGGLVFFLVVEAEKLIIRMARPARRSGSGGIDRLSRSSPLGGKRQPRLGRPVLPREFHAHPLPCRQLLDCYPTSHTFPAAALSRPRLFERRVEQDGVELEKHRAGGLHCRRPGSACGVCPVADGVGASGTRRP